jgi:hypothetical protein
MQVINTRALTSESYKAEEAHAGHVQTWSWPEHDVKDDAGAMMHHSIMRCKAAY